MIDTLEADGRGAPARDALTGLATEVAGRATLARWQSEGQGNVQAMLVSLSELDTLNTAFGRRVGDAVLAETARRMSRFAADEFTGCDPLLARIGGSQLLLAVRQDTSRERWRWLAEALAESLASPYSGSGEAATIRVGPRVVLARASAGEEQAVLLDKLAEGLLAQQKLGGARVTWIGGMSGRFGAERRQLEHDLLSAIHRNEIVVLYQPQYRASDQRLIGAEALARWNHAEAGQLGATTLFSLAERVDHLPQLSQHVLGLALKEASGWPSSLRLSVNASASDLLSTTYESELTQLASSSGFPLKQLTLEITEESLLRNLGSAKEMLGRLSASSVRIALDDFGAGFCNFNYLKQLPLDLLKLDRSMVDQIAESERDLAVFRGITAMARALELEVVVEGIETEAQRAVVAAEGCSYYQGFLGSPPISADAFRILAAAED